MEGGRDKVAYEEDGKIAAWREGQDVHERGNKRETIKDKQIGSSLRWDEKKISYGEKTEKKKKKQPGKDVEMGADQRARRRKRGKQRQREGQERSILFPFTLHN